MTIVKFTEITIDTEMVKEAWDGHDLITPNMPGLLADFNMYHSDATYDDDHATREEMSRAKTNLFMTFITGVLSAMTVESNLRKNFVMPKSSVKKESEDFAKTLLS